MEEYNSKHALYCWLCQEIPGAKTQVKGLQQVSNSCVMLIFCGICMIFDYMSVLHQTCCSVCVLCWRVHIFPKYMLCVSLLAMHDGDCFSLT